MEKQHSPEWEQRHDERIKAVLEKASDKKPMSFTEAKNLAITLKALEAFTYIHEAHCRTFWPFANPDKPSKDMRKFAGKAIVYAAALGQTQQCKNLHDLFLTDIDQKDNFGQTGLSKAVLRKRLGTAEWFLSEGASPYKERRFNPILTACCDGCIPALKMFQRHGIDFNKPISYFEKGKKFYQFERGKIYPLEIALNYKQPKATKFLLESGANPDLIWDESLRQIVKENPKATEVLGQENITLLKNYFETHPLLSKKTISIFKKIFSKTH